MSKNASQPQGIFQVTFLNLLDSTFENLKDILGSDLDWTSIDGYSVFKNCVEISRMKNKYNN